MIYFFFLKKRINLEFIKTKQKYRKKHVSIGGENENQQTEKYRAQNRPIQTERKTTMRDEITTGTQGGSPTQVRKKVACLQSSLKPVR